MVPKPSIPQRELCFVEARAEWRCRRCNMAATTDQTLKGLRTGGSREMQANSHSAMAGQHVFRKFAEQGL
eukprot:1366565-Pyramimonas_sp.AAC.1